MPIDAAYNSALYQQEILNSRLDVRSYCLRTVVKEAYDNIAQMLSLARVEMALLQRTAGKDLEERLNATGRLVGKAMGDMKDLCRMLDPDKEFSDDNSFIEVMRSVLRQIHPEMTMYLQTAPINQLNNNRAVFLSGVLIELKNVFLRYPSDIKYLHAQICDDNLVVEIEYTGGVHFCAEKKEADNDRLCIRERLRLIRGTFIIEQKNKTINYIRLTMPMS